MSRPRILLLAGDGQLGSALRAPLARIGDVVATSRQANNGVDLRADLTDADRVSQILDQVQPTVVVNAAAYTRVDEAEDHPDRAMAVNARLPETLATRGPDLLLHISTDYVFDGAGRRAYIESDRANPLNVYGQSKLAGEAAVLAGANPAIVLRSSWLYSARPNNFFTTMLKLARSGRPLRVVNDQIGSPTSANDLARGIASVVVAMLARNEDLRRASSGVYHLSAAGAVSWHDFARDIFRLTDEQAALASLTPCTSEDYPQRANRPAYSVLDSSRAHAEFGVRLPPYAAGLAAVAAEFRAGEEKSSRAE